MYRIQNGKMVETWHVVDGLQTRQVRSVKFLRSILPDMMHRKNWIEEFLNH